MSANPPGLDQLDPAEFDPAVLDEQFNDSDLPTGGGESDDDLGLPDTPPASPDGHHQTHGVPVGTN